MCSLPNQTCPRAGAETAPGGSAAADREAASQARALGRPSVVASAFGAEERMLAVRARHAPDLLVRIGVLVARRGGSLRSAVEVRDAEGARCALALVVTGTPRTLERLPLWIAGLADVEGVEDLLAPARPAPREREEAHPEGAPPSTR